MIKKEIDDDAVSSIADTEEHSRAFSDDDEDCTDTPAVLVRKEDKAVFVLRILTILLLVAAAAVTASMVYIFSAKAEEDAYERSFEETAGKIIESFLEESRKKMWNGRAISASINSFMVATGAVKWNLTIPKWEEITEQARIVSDVNVVAWSPFLYNSSELEQFLAYAIEQTDGGVPYYAENPPCYICGGPDMVVTTPDAGVNLGGAIFPCRDLEGAGLSGSISRCDLVLGAAEGICFCGPKPKEENEVPPRNTSQGLWMVDDAISPLALDDTSPPPYNPMWQIGIRGATKTTYMYNQMSEPVRRRALEGMLRHKVPSFSEFFKREGGYYKNYVEARLGELVTNLVYPVFALDTDEVIGSLVMEMLWSDFLPSVFPPESDLLDIVIANSCNQSYTFRIDDQDDALVLVGDGDMHDPRMDSDLVAYSTFEQFDTVIRFASGKPPEKQELDFCRYRFFVYPTQTLKDQYVTNDPVIYTVIVLLIFFGTSVVFLVYDWVVRRRQKKVLQRATQTGAIVSSLFPRTVRKRLYDPLSQANPSQVRQRTFVRNSKANLESFLSDSKRVILDSEPIADLFPHATVCFIDICGFTSWSSERDPSQVFRLLETIYSIFDDVAEKDRIFKVETIGDSYVAVSGVPDPRKDHAVAVVRFAYDCLRKFEQAVKRLEVQLGPSTGELRARCGIHSGPVTAGVLRGAKARFQLFGDTMNMSSRMESTGEPGRIHVSQETADLLIKAGKNDWCTLRSDLVEVKGKGKLRTFWVKPRAENGIARSTMSSGDQDDLSMFEDNDDGSKEAKMTRLVDWNVQVLYSMLQKVVQQRPPTTKKSSKSQLAKAEAGIADKSGIVFDEIKEVVDVAPFHESAVDMDDEDIDLGTVVKEQLREFVCCISATYHDVPFHCFEHASHVTMSAGKLMKRIVSPNGIDYEQDAVSVAKEAHDITYGFSSDALMQFAVVFSALIHDADHTGLPNAELVKMNTTASVLYRGRSVAEQNSVDVAWAILQSDRFDKLRSCIYTNVDELQRFRQLVVNSVMATDIADKELQQLRRNRWTRAFDDDENPSNPLEALNLDRRATIVLEYILQASDIAHTMQHWHTYVKWNERLFQERYKAYLDGHESEDPVHGWYQGEIGFYKFYIIPLAKKLKECGVFGVSHFEYLNYAEANLVEWERKGKEVVEGIHSRAVAKYGGIELSC